MRLKAKDTLHVSSVGPDNLAPGQEFEVSDDTGRQLVEKGLASIVKSKSEPKHANKMDAAPLNKSSLSKKDT